MKTYLFDFDGTLVDSMPTYVSSMLRILDENHIPYEKDIVKVITPLGMAGTAEYYIHMGLDVSLIHICKIALRWRIRFMKEPLLHMIRQVITCKPQK